AARANHLFPISDIAHLLNSDPTYGPFPLGDVFRSEVGNLWQTNFTAFQNMRTQVTTLSMDMDRMGAAPGLAAPAAGGPQGPGIFTLPPIGQPNGLAFPSGQLFSFAALLAQRGNATITNPGSDMRPNDWRSLLADMGLVDLNRPLTAFPDRTNPANGQR